MPLPLVWERWRRKAAAILLHENWMIGWIDAPISQSLQWKQPPKVNWIGERSKERYLADPFAWPILPDVILCEDYDFKTGLGSIARLQLNGNSIRRESCEAFSVPGHLSFPFLFHHDGKIYCMPESCSARKLVIYEWHEADQSWKEFATPLTGIAAADSVLFKHGGYFWIAYTDVDLHAFDNLNLCYSRELAGPWTRHAGNPVRRALRNARCGGTPFTFNGKLYRPAQDCSETYGGAICIMEIEVCTPNAFAEREVTRIAPEAGKNPHGFHTLSAWGDKCLVDGKRMFFSPQRVLGKIWRRVERLLGGPL